MKAALLFVECVNLATSLNVDLYVFQTFMILKKRNI